MKNLFCRAPVMVSLVALLLATSSAKAACGIPGQGSGVTAVLPFVAQSADEDSAQSTERHHDHDGSILGLWHVTYVLSDGTPDFQSFKFWHPDGTEWESANGSPLGGNVCVGVWRETKTGTIRLHHVAWTFANGILTGTLTIDEINTVAPDGRTYKGTFTATHFDLNGNLLQQQKGTQTAKRITVDSTGAP
jgi:uncharacterized membrane protein